MVHVSEKTFRIWLLMEEKEVEIVEENTEIPDKSHIFSERKAPNEKKNTIIISAVAFVLVASFAATMIVGTLGNNDSSKGQIPTLNWTTNYPGFYNENGKMSSEGVYDIKIETDNAGVNYARINSVKAPKGAKEYVLPNTYEENGKIYKFYSVGNDESTDIFRDTTGSTIEGIYVQTLYREIKSYAFSGLEALKKISFADVSQGQMSIGSYAFSQDTLLENVEFPTQLKTIDSFAFEGCVALQTISLPNNLTSLGEGVFKDSGIKEICFEGTEAEWNMRVIKHASWDEGISDYQVRFLK